MRRLPPSVSRETFALNFEGLAKAPGVLTSGEVNQKIRQSCRGHTWNSTGLAKAFGLRSLQPLNDLMRQAAHRPE
jgi:hypothetical protein